MLILVHASLGLFVFWPFTLVTFRRHVSAPLVRSHDWACLSGAKMCVRQRRAVICQSGVGGHGFQAWPPWCITTVRVVDAGRGGGGGPGALSMWICPFPCFGGLECVARDCWPACFSLLPAQQQQQQQPSVRWSLWSCMALWCLRVFFSFFRKAKPLDICRSYSFSFALHWPRWGPSSQSDRGVPPCFTRRAVGFNLAQRHIAENRCAVRPVLFKLVWLIMLKINRPRGMRRDYQ